MRVVSLLPSITETVNALGYGKNLVGRSHECDGSERIKNLPVCTEPKITPHKRSGEINQDIGELVQNGLSVYKVKTEVLAQLQPDIILTQDHCEVCAVSFGDVKKAVADVLEKKPVLVSVSPTNLDEVLDSFVEIAAALGIAIEGMNLSDSIKARMGKIHKQVQEKNKKPAVACIEWLNPLMVSGNWIPELVSMAHAENIFSQPGKHSPKIEWGDIKNADPDVLIVMPCGFDIKQTMAELDQLKLKDGWGDLKAVRNQQVYVVDGNRYFNRPGPGILESTRILAEILHPDLFEPRFKNTGWINIE